MLQGSVTLLDTQMILLVKPQLHSGYISRCIWQGSLRKGTTELMLQLSTLVVPMEAAAYGMTGSNQHIPVVTKCVRAYSLCAKHHAVQASILLRHLITGTTVIPACCVTCRWTGHRPHGQSRCLRCTLSRSCHTPIHRDTDINIRSSWVLFLNVLVRCNGCLDTMGHV